LFWKGEKEEDDEFFKRDGLFIFGRSRSHLDPTFPTHNQAKFKTGKIQCPML